MSFKNILVTTDFSDISFNAFSTAAKEAKDSNGNITLLTIVQDWVVPPTVIDQLPLPNKIDEYRADILSSTKKRLCQIADQKFSGLQVKSDVVMSIKSDAAEITDYAKKNNCDLIVMSGHGRGSLGAAILGSVTQKVLALATCPVLVVPAKKAAQKLSNS